jgi:hypothetical protein
MINPELTSGAVLMRDQHVKVCLHVGCSLGSAVKVSSKHYINSKCEHSTQNTSSMIHRLIVICHSSEDQPLHYMDNNVEDNTDGCKATHRLGDHSPSTKETVSLNPSVSICNCNTVHVIVPQIKHETSPGWGD